MKLGAQKLSLDEQIDVARNQLVRARIFLDLWWYYHGSTTRSESLASLNQFPEFFRFDEHAHLTAFIVHITTIFDKGKGKIRLGKLKETILKNFAVGEEIKKILNPLFEETDAIVSKVFILRHQAFAHRSEKDSYDDSFKQANVSFDELLELTEKSKQILDQFLRLTKQEEVTFRDLPKKDLELMLIKLKPLSDDKH